MCTLYIGMDIHKNYIYAVGLDKEGNKKVEQKFSADALETFLDMIGTDIEAAIESTTCWLHIYEQMNARGIKVVLVNVQGTKDKMKTDKLDAYKLADGLRTGYLKTSYIAPKEFRDLRDLTRHRLSIVNERTAFKNMVSSILIKRGIRHSFSDVFGKAGKEFLRQLDVGIDTVRMQSYLKIVESLDGQIKEFDSKIEQVAKLNDQAMLLTTVCGISYLAALTLVAEAGDIGRFPEAKKYAKYVGLVPSVSQSGNHTHIGRTIKNCSVYSKRILIQSTHVHVMHSNSQITKHYRKVKRKHGENRAIVSAANKVARTVWAMLVHNQPFKEN